MKESDYREPGQPERTFELPSCRSSGLSAAALPLSGTQKRSRTFRYSSFLYFMI